MMTVLIVDDDAATRIATAKAIHAVLGCEVLLADGPAAAARLYAHADVVLTDWMMPDGGGQRVVAECRKPVVVVSGSSDVSHRHRLWKPASIEAIVQAVRAALEEARV